MAIYNPATQRQCGTRPMTRGKVPRATAQAIAALSRLLPLCIRKRSRQERKRRRRVGAFNNAEASEGASGPRATPRTETHRKEPTMFQPAGPVRHPAPPWMREEPKIPHIGEATPQLTWLRVWMRKCLHQQPQTTRDARAAQLAPQRPRDGRTTLRS